MWSSRLFGGTGTITIANLVISGGLNITFDAIKIVIDGLLNIESGATLNVIADRGVPEPSICSIQDPAAGTLTLSSSTPIDTTSTCNVISGVFSLPAGTLTTGITGSQCKFDHSRHNNIDAVNANCW